jgi:gliding motility-associated-like protein
MDNIQSYFFHPAPRIFLKIALLLSFLLFTRQTFGYHLVGGSITYRYLGTSNGKLMFRVTLDMYRDCSNPIGAYFDPEILISVYERKADANGDTVIIDTLTIQLAKVIPVSPPNSAKNCTVKPITCLQEGLYNDTLFVNPSSYGYYLETQRCCRNTMLNVPDNVGQTYFAIIPPTNTINSTPVFNAVPSPYFCAYDTVNLNYSAYEPDGDSLVYSLERPWAGGNNTTQIIPPPSPVFSGIPYVPYNFGYSPAYPLSKAGYAYIDMFTGVLTLYAPGVGRYAIAVDVREYRNRKLISITRRDVQLITVSGCPKQPPPFRVPIVDSLPIDNSTTNVYTVKAGHRLSFNIRYKANNSNVTEFSATGFFNQGSVYSHQPSFTFKLDSGFVTAYFNWKTTCKEGRTFPYTFTVAVTDTGCPSKTTYEGYKVFVNKGSDHINGESKLCSDTPVAVYTTDPPLKGDTVYWKVTGGIYKLINDSSILVSWGSAVTSGLVQVMSRNDAGCVSDTISFKVKISPVPKPPKIIGPLTTCTGIVNPYTTAGYSSAHYTWKAITGTIISNDSLSKHINILWNLGASNKLLVAYTDSNGCNSDTSSITVNTKFRSADTIIGNSPVCPNTSGLVYKVNSDTSATYYWKIEGGEQTGGGNSRSITVRWGDKGIGYVKVYISAPGACPGDTIVMKVIKDYNLKISPIKGDTNLCSYSKGELYSVTGIPGYRYNWTISGGDIMSGNNTSRIISDWNKEGRGIVKVQEVTYDSVNNIGCASPVVSLNVTLRPKPDPSEIKGPVNICEGDTFVYKIDGSFNSTFIWKVNGKISMITADSILITDSGLKKQTDTILLEATEVSQFNCPGPWRSLKLIVHKRPVTSSITGTDIICFPDHTTGAYQVNGFPNSTFHWTAEGGLITSGKLTNKITVSWQQAGNRTISVQEFNDIGCPGIPQHFAVTVDSLAIDMQLVTTELANDKVIDIFWKGINTMFFKGYYRIYRSVEGQPYYRLIDSAPDTRNNYTDKNVNTAGYAYRYRIEAVNQCGSYISSPQHRSVKLKGAFDKDTTISLKWNAYEGWPVDRYTILYSRDLDTMMQNYGFTNDSNYIVYKTLEGYRRCFRIAAKKASANNTISWSNIVCIDFDPILWIPNVFTPNGDATNNTFRIFAHNYKSFKADIYNRWGEHIFTTNDPAIQWDGKFKGADCPEGVFLYIVNVQGGKNNIYRSGTVTLLR